MSYITFTRKAFPGFRNPYVMFAIFLVHSLFVFHHICENTFLRGSIFAQKMLILHLKMICEENGIFRWLVALCSDLFIHMFSCDLFSLAVIVSVLKLHSFYPQRCLESPFSRKLDLWSFLGELILQSHWVGGKIVLST